MITLKKMNKMNKNTLNSSYSSSSVILVQKQNEQLLNDEFIFRDFLNTFLFIILFCHLQTYNFVPY